MVDASFNCFARLGDMDSDEVECEGGVGYANLPVNLTAGIAE